MKPKSVALYLLGQVFSIAGAGVAMFWSAGRTDWPAAWAVIGVWLAWFIALDVIVLRFNPQLMAERLAPPRDAKKWDRAILMIIRLVELGRYIVAGLDQRYGWTVGFPSAAQIAGLAACLPGIALFDWAMDSNAYFSQVVRIQSERGHTVVSGGPYRYVRHPGYAAMILYDLALSIILGSWWAIAASGVHAVLMVARTALEDRTLQAELDGYREYAQRVRYRLAPGVW